MSWNTMLSLLRLWRQRARTRRDIARLDGLTMRDLGVSAGQMNFEAQKPFWRA